MRLKIQTKHKKQLIIPYNYNYTLSSIIYNKINDIDIAQRLHNKFGFKYFTFSQLHLDKLKTTPKGLQSRTGHTEFQISSPNNELIKSMFDSYTQEPNIKFHHTNLTVTKVEILKTPSIKKDMKFKTLSPINTTIKKNIDDKLKTWDLAPSTDKFYEQLRKNLLNKYSNYYNLESTDKEISFTSELRKVKSKRIDIKDTHHRAYHMDLNLEGDEDLIRFAYDVGVGEHNSMGMGMLATI